MEGNGDRTKLKHDIVDYFREQKHTKQQIIDACDDIRFLGVVCAKSAHRYETTAGMDNLIASAFERQHRETVCGFVERLAAIELRKLKHENGDSAIDARA